MPQRGVRQPLRSIWNWIAWLLAQQEMEQRARAILTEFICICGTTADIRIAKLPNGNICASRGGPKDRNHFKSRPIDGADFSSLLIFFGLDIDPASQEPVIVRIDTLDADVSIKPEYTNTDSETTLTLHLTQPPPSVVQPN